MSTRGPRLEFAVGAFLLLALVSLLVLAIASTNGRFGFGFGGHQYTINAIFNQTGQLRPNAPVKIRGVTVGRVAGIELNPDEYKSTIVALSIDSRFNKLPTDTTASILTGGLLGESYVSLDPGGDEDTLEPGDEIFLTSDAVDLIQMVSKFMFSAGPSSGSTPASGER